MVKAANARILNGGFICRLTIGCYKYYDVLAKTLQTVMRPLSPVYNQAVKPLNTAKEGF
jgi:hypothetical protein